MGMVTPIGIGKEAFWDSLAHGRGAGGPITHFDASAYSSKIAAEVTGFDPKAEGLNEGQIARGDLATQFAIAATYGALRDSGLDLDKVNRRRLGVCVGTGIGAIGTAYDFWYDVMVAEDDERYFAGIKDPSWYTRCMINRAALEVGLAIGAHSACATIAAACASGSEAAGRAWRAIRNGEADVIFTGGADAAINPISFAGFCAMGATSKRNDEPRKASRPFDAERDGFLMAEGGGMLVLEELEHALARGAHIYAEVVGFAATANAYHIAALPKEGEAMARALLQCIAHGGIKPEHIGYINAHGTGTGQNDIFETAAYKEAFGDLAYKIPISSTKSMTGHAIGGISTVELAACALAFEHDLLPPTINYEHPDPECDLDYIPNVAREAHINVALSNANGFGGLQSAMVITRYGWQP
jgi:3-oxoacyl-[acyl-carrier-protein] synthase II